MLVSSGRFVQDDRGAARRAGTIDLEAESVLAKRRRDRGPNERPRREAGLFAASLVLVLVVAAPFPALAQPTHEPPGHRDGADHPGASHGNPHADEPTVSEVDDGDVSESLPELGDPALGVKLSTEADATGGNVAPSGTETLATALPSTALSSLGELDIVLRTGGSGVSDYVFAQQDASDDDEEDDEDDEESEIPGVPAAGEGDRDDAGDRGDPTLPFSGVDVRALLSFGALLVAGGYLMTRWRRFMIG